MKNSRVCIAVSCVVLLTVAVAYAADQPTSAPTAPAPAPEMAKLKAYEGKWMCMGQINASPFGPAHKSSTKVTAHLDLGGFWLSGRVAESKTAENPMPMEGMFHETWDPGAKQFLMLWVDNSGGWAQETSAGWDGDTMVWTGDGFGGGQKMGERDSFTMKGPGEFAHTMAINVGGQWTPLGQETCRSASASTAAPKK
jgi:hypothetical protein